MRKQILFLTLGLYLAAGLQATNFNPLPGTPDGAPGSLRDAISIANNNGEPDLITLSAGTYLLTIPGTGENNNATGDLDIRADGGNALTIRGAGMDLTFIDGNALDQVIQVINATVFLEDLSVVNADAIGFSGGAVYKSGSRLLTLNRCRLSNNNVRGFISFGIVELNNCIIENNVNKMGPGAGVEALFSGNNVFRNCIIRNNQNLPQGPGGAYLQNATTQFINCLFEGNISAGPNGALRNETAASNCSLLNCTFANNQGAETRAEIRNVGTMDMQNCIFYHPGRINFENFGPSAVTTSSGGNISSDNSMAAFLTNTHDLNNTDPLFEDPGAGNYRLTAGSPAVDNGLPSAGLPALDLDGNDRVQDGDDNVSKLVDSGAYELPKSIPTLSQWGLLLFGLIVCVLGVVSAYNLKKRALAEW
jgi:hypothetical protein